MEVKLNSTRQVFILEFPGVIKNTAKALRMVGGQTLVNNCLRKDFYPELYWRKDDNFSKPITGEKSFKRRKLVLRVKKICDGKLEISLVGVVRVEFKFTSLASCQYLPVTADDKTQNSYLSIQKFLLPVDLKNYGHMTSEETPLFISPPVFLRGSNQPTTFYRCKTLGEVLSIDVGEVNTFADTRGNRAVNWFTVKFGDSTPTTEMHEKTISNFLAQDFPEIYEFVKTLFTERPIWSTTAVRWRFTVSFKGVINTGRMLSFLGQVAYYIENGPWQRLWCRIGYDPIQHPTEAKMYQALDFRLSRSILKAQAFSGSQQSVSARFKGSHCLSNVDSIDKFPNPPHVFKAGVVPTLAIAYFQVCDIELEAVQRIVHENDGQEPTECHKVDGFLVKDYGATFRRLMIATLLPPEKVEAFITRDLLSDKKKKRKRVRPGQKRQPKPDTTNIDTVKNYISSVGATLGVQGGQESDESDGEETHGGDFEDGDGDTSSSFDEGEDGEFDDEYDQEFMHQTFGNQPDVAEFMHKQRTASALSEEPQPSPSNASFSRGDLRHLWQETSNHASVEGESTLEFSQL